MSHARIAILKRALVVVGFAGVTATLLAPQGASAFGHGPGFGRGAAFSHGMGGGFGMRGMGQRTNFDGRGFGHMREPGLHRIPHFPSHIFDRRPGHVPPIRIVLPPHRWHPPIFFPPYHRGPYLPPVIVRAPVPVSVGVAVPVARPLPVYAPVPAQSCLRDGTVVSIVFVPTATAADITAFLKTYNVTMADGPNEDGVYRLRLSADVLPQNEVLQVIGSMRSQTAIVSAVNGA